MKRPDPTTTDASRRTTSRLRNSWSGLLRPLGDLVAVQVAFAISHRGYAWLIQLGVFDRPVPSRITYFGIALLVGAIAITVFWYLGAYRERASVLNLWDLQVAVKGHLLTAALLFAFLFVVNGDYSRVVIGGGLIIGMLLTLLERRLIAAILRSLQLSGKLGRRVLIYGCGETGRLLMKKIAQAPHVGRTVVGFIDDVVPEGRFIECRITQTAQTIFCAPVLGQWEDLPAVAHRYEIHELFVTAPASESERLPEILTRAQECGLQVGVVPQMGNVRVDQLRVQDLSAIPVLRPHTVPSRPLYLATKRILDVIATLTLLAVTMPLWIIAAILIRLTDSGPIFFAQERIGHRGRPFRIFKFRTMRSDASPYAPSPTHDHDPRITPIGRVLRTAGLDELPQLINVLLGNMSLVGPRPEMPFIVQDYTPLERQRLLAKPGITGLWQLSADRHDAIHVNLEYDLYYLRHQSLLLDCLILLETVIFTVEVIGRRLASAAGGVLDRLGFPTRSPSPAPSDPDGHGARFTAANEIRRGAHEADQDRKPQPIQIPLRLGSVSPPDRVMEHPPQRKWRRSKR